MQCMETGNMGSNDTVTKSGSRGTKMVRSTGMDTSSYGEKGTKSLEPKMKGGVSDISSSIKDGKVRSY